MRGTRAGTAAAPALRRFIPARAGNTIRSWSVHIPRPVHPRACGEHTKPPAKTAHKGGSSPRVRGTPGAAVLSDRRPTVHPRACGEHFSASSALRISAGSSPRVRGTLLSAFENAPPGRFIPARAGNTERLRPRVPSSAVHPRACGEHSIAACSGLVRFGSSPRVRGTLSPEARRMRCIRFIPARAGNTSSIGQAASSATVHPRACGEHGVRWSAKLGSIGSSPRVRGTRLRRR